MIKESTYRELKDKFNFTKDISSVLSNYNKNTAKIVYDARCCEEFDDIAEYLVAYVDGEVVGARNVKWDSKFAIYNEIIKLIEGYYDEVEYYKELCGIKNYKKLDF